MTNLDSTEVHSRTITAMFETHEAAQKAVAALEQAGIPSRHISLVAGGDSTASTATSTTEGETGFWASLKDLFLPEEDRYAYAEGLRRGGYLLSVKTDEANYNRVLDIVDLDGSVDMDERETIWKAEGWKGYDAAAVPAVGATAYAARETVAVAPVASVAKSSAPAAALTAGQDEVIPVYEEKLQVGKRDVNHGRVRLRSYVVDTPVSEQVTLHSETVQIDRKAVDRPVTATDTLFKDRVIEATERTEEAVIAKDVRVKEEISLRKTAEDRVQTVSDTVRRTEVEIDDARGQVAGGTVRKFVAGQDAGLIVENMDVIASDGVKIGTVDHLEGSDKIKLAKHTSPDGQHHYVSLAWVDHVDQHVHLNQPSATVKTSW